MQDMQDMMRRLNQSALSKENAHKANLFVKSISQILSASAFVAASCVRSKVKTVIVA